MNFCSILVWSLVGWSHLDFISILGRFLFEFFSVFRSFRGAYVKLFSVFKFQCDLLVSEKNLRGMETVDGNGYHERCRSPIAV